jgi:flagellar hook-length control protein FliK
MPVNPAAGTAADPAAALGPAAAAGVTGPQPTAPAAPAAPAAGTPPPATPMPAPPAAQLAMRIAPLRLDADGVHRLTVNLHPADLGPVQVVAEIRNGDISVQLTGTTDEGTAAMRDALADLRRELEDSGFGNCSLDLRQGTAQQEQARQQFAAAGNGAGRGDTAAAPAAPAPAESGPASGRAPGSSRLDVRA